MAEPSRGAAAQLPLHTGQMEVVMVLKDTFKDKLGSTDTGKGVGEALATCLVETEERK